MKIHVFEEASETAAALAERVRCAVQQQPTLVLGLPTGRTPIDLYAQLRRMHAEGLLDASRLTTFNLDEFVGLAADHPGSFRTFMNRHLFDALRLRPDQVQFLNGAAADLDEECRRYEAAIAATGGIDLQIVGIGANGHIGFNEPGEMLASRTHRVTLADSTRRDNAPLFGGDAQRVPLEALSMGVGTILAAKSLILLATGERKAQCIQATVKGPLTTHLPASFLQLHRDAELYLDRAAASKI